MRWLRKALTSKGKGASEGQPVSMEAPWLMHATLHRQTFLPDNKNDHEHCEFCWQRISEYNGDEHEGYTDDAQEHWVCMACWAERRSEYQSKERFT